MRVSAICLIAICAVVSVGCGAIKVQRGEGVAQNLDFEAPTDRVGVPPGWAETGADATEHRLANYAFRRDSSVRRSGATSGRLRFVGKDSSKWAATIQCIEPPASMLDREARLSGYLKTEGVARGAYRGDESPGAGLWLRADTRSDADGHQPFENMDGRTVMGAVDWKRYEVRIRVPNDTYHVCFGLHLAGVGTVWADDLELEYV